MGDGNGSQGRERARQAARRHVDEVVRPGVAQWERDGRFPREAVAAAAAGGLTGLFAPQECGGLGLSFADGMPAFEELGRGDAAYAFALSMHNAVATAVARFAAPAPRERWARRLASGEALGGFVASEPQGGSDPAGNTTLATPLPGGGWRIRGRKAWVSLAGEADVYLVLCRTEQGRGYRDAMMALVEAERPGVTVARIYDKMASSFLPIGELELDVEIATDEVVAPPGSGFQAALGAIDVARADIAAISVGLAAEALDVALAWARGRELYGAPLLDLQALQFMLADVETDIVAGRLLVGHAAALLGTPEGTVACAHAKRFCPDAALRAALACSEMLGGYGWLNDTPLPRFIALAKMLQVVDGTAEVQRVVIGRSLRRRFET